MTDAPTSAGAEATVCWCSRKARAEAELVRLRGHDDVALCDACIGWLGDQRSQWRGNQLARAVPILATANVQPAVEHTGFEPATLTLIRAGANPTAASVTTI